MTGTIKKLFRKYEEAIMYIFFGGLTTLVYYITRFSSRFILGDFKGSVMIATAVAQIVAITFAFITNKKFVFKSRSENIGQLAREAVSFYAGRGVTFLLDMLISYIFVERFWEFFVRIFSLDKINYDIRLMQISIIDKLMGNPQKMNEFIWTMLSQVMILILNYFFSKLFVFRKKKNSEENGK